MKLTKPQPKSTMSFSRALENLKAGKGVRRKSWDEGRKIFPMPPLELPAANSKDDGPRVNARTAKFIGDAAELQCAAYFVDYDSNTNIWVPGWAPTSSDLLAEDWLLV